MKEIFVNRQVGRKPILQISQKSHKRVKKETDKDGKEKKVPKKIEPNMNLSGKLNEDTNMYKGVVIKYNEPEEARKPKKRWRLYPFKGDQALPFIPIHRQSAYLLGRSRLIADIPIDHPSCSKQHAVLQFRLVEYERDDGTTGKHVRPYIIDLESANGTFVNNNQIEPRRYVELLEKDVLKFGYSTREYVIIHEDSKEDELEEEEELMSDK
ncbi:smad nuclear-interacting protein 1-like isoform X2 [Centruroides sculpturatus]|uniref:smad nuclear-interacting protein 1-like isoform X2 n=1 Tax=Centruroides sculpturatus TaxID=218467 RepID=UPI000C6D8098|nr:smad nuclear-interacting protein 1-like isoform X2 [Centruroides sculpturatus]